MERGGEGRERKRMFARLRLRPKSFARERE